MKKQEHPIINQQQNKTSTNKLNHKPLNKDEIADTITKAIDDNDTIALKAILDRIHYADLADYINFATYEQKQKILLLLKNKLNPEILLEFKLDILLSVIDILGKKTFTTLTNKLPIEDILQILEQFQEEERSKIISNLSSTKQKIIKKALSYPKNCVGLLMERKYVAVKATETVGSVLSYLSENQDLPSDYDEIFILNNNDHPIGSIHISKLIKSKHTDKIEVLMNKTIKVVEEFLDQEELSYIFRHYDLSSAPVINKAKKMVGVVYVDQIVDVIEEEAEEDIMKLGGVGITDLYSAFFKTALRRFPWLFCNLIMACLVSVVIDIFQNQISELAVLAAIMPIVASMGGNAGTQSVTVAIRAIANKDIVSANIWQVVFKEMLSCFTNGLVLGTIGGIILMFLHKQIALSMIFGLAVTANFTLAGIWGSLIPIGLDKAGLDPAISSSVFVTFLTDLLGFFIFLSLASMIIL
ncbi:MAG: magnesium transporter [Rickettsiales bacterium]|nr:magnesium transporter [Rickettsiales bacterium]